MSQLPPSFKSARYANEPVIVQEDGEPYLFLPHTITTHRDAWKASLSILFKHVADFHMLVTNIIAETYNLDVNEMVATIQASPKYKEMMTAPEVHALGYFSKEDLERHIPIQAEEEPEVKPVKRVIRKKKAVVAEEAPKPEAPKPEVTKPKAPRKKKQSTQATPDGNSQI